jgi:hypothetical protein
VTAPSATPLTQLGFLTILRDANGFLGGYLVTNLWGRPLEFRLSTAVQPNRVQQILYAHTLSGFVCGELVGKTLIEKTATPAQLVLTDTADALALRRVTDVPVVWVAPPDDPHAANLPVARPAGVGRGAVCTHPDFAGDVSRLKEYVERLGGLDLAEPFARIREAIAEARRMGVTQRAA